MTISICDLKSAHELNMIEFSLTAHTLFGVMNNGKKDDFHGNGNWRSSGVLFLTK